LTSKCEARRGGPPWPPSGWAGTGAWDGSHTKTVGYSAHRKLGLFVHQAPRPLSPLRRQGARKAVAGDLPPPIGFVCSLDTCHFKLETPPPIGFVFPNPLAARIPRNPFAIKHLPLFSPHPQLGLFRIIGRDWNAGMLEYRVSSRRPIGFVCTKRALGPQAARDPVTAGWPNWLRLVRHSRVRSDAARRFFAKREDLEDSPPAAVFLPLATCNFKLLFTFAF
jgi:hypothetical protein